MCSYGMRLVLNVLSWLSPDQNLRLNPRGRVAFLLCKALLQVSDLCGDCGSELGVLPEGHVFIIVYGLDP